MASKEDLYIEQLQTLGVYQPAFDPAIKSLATLERELSRARKQWKATAPDGKAPDVLSPYYKMICQLRADILAHRDALGLTPRGLQRLKGKNAAAPESDAASISSRLDALLERTRSYD